MSGLGERNPSGHGKPAHRDDNAAGAFRSPSPQTRAERIRILDEYAELDIEQQLRSDNDRWSDLGREW